jgi:hypothetical protein
MHEPRSIHCGRRCERCRWRLLGGTGIAGLFGAALLALLAPREQEVAAPDLEMLLTGAPPTESEDPGASTRPVPRRVDRHDRFRAILKQGRIDLLFFGDSIAEYWKDHPDVWWRYFGPMSPACFATGGDRTQHLLWRIQNGEVEGIRPKVIVVLIGTNNLAHDSADDVVAGVTAVVRTLRELVPQSKVLLLGLFPRQPQPDAWRRRIQEINARLARLDDGHRLRFLDLDREFLEPDGSISPAMMYDYVHLTRKGFETWARAIRPVIVHMMGATFTSQPAE